MKRLNTKFFGLAFLITLPFTTIAGDGSSVRGGGSIVGSGSNATLADFLSPGVCMPQEGSEVYAELPALHRILAQVEQLDWYLALTLRREIKRLNFCWTSLPDEFKRARAEQGLSCDTEPGLESVTDQVFQLNSNERMTAFREGLTVIIDQQEYRALNPRVKAMQLIHEAAHSFFPAGISVCQRQRLVRGFVGIIEAVRIGEIRNRRRLHFALSNHGINSWIANELLDANRAQVEFYFSTLDEQKNLVLSSSRPESLIDALSQVELYLGENQRLNYFEYLSSIIEDIILNGSLEDFRSLFAKDYEQISPEMIAISLYSRLSNEKVDILTELASIGHSINMYWQVLAESTLTQEQSRILAGYHLRSLGTSTTEFGMRPLNRTRFRINTRNERIVLPLGLKAAGEFLAILIMQNRWDQVSALYSNNPLFYTALGLKNQRNYLAEMIPQIERERVLAQSVLREITGRIENNHPVSGILRDFFEYVHQILAHHNQSHQYEQLLREINFDQFLN